MDIEYLKRHYDMLSDEELLSIQSGELVPNAKELLDAEIVKRGLKVHPSTPRYPPTADKKATMNMTARVLITIGAVFVAMFFLGLLSMAFGSDRGAIYGLLSIAIIGGIPYFAWRATGPKNRKLIGQ